MSQRKRARPADASVALQANINRIRKRMKQTKRNIDAAEDNFPF